MVFINLPNWVNAELDLFNNYLGFENSSLKTITVHKTLNFF